MGTETDEVRRFFEEAVAIKEERGKNYDNAHRSAYEIALSMFSADNRYLVAIWPVVQKVSRLVTLAQEANEGNLDIEAWEDTSKDLANYDAMQYVYVKNMDKLAKTSLGKAMAGVSDNNQSTNDATKDEEPTK